MTSREEFAKVLREVVKRHIRNQGDDTPDPGCSDCDLFRALAVAFAQEHHYANENCCSHEPGCHDSDANRLLRECGLEKT